MSRERVLIETMCLSCTTTGRVLEVLDAGRVVVACGDGADAPRLECEVLVTSPAGPVVLAPGDAVLLWRPAGTALPGVVMGRVGPSHAAPAPEEEMPDELVIEASQQLTLRVGGGSITMRED
ncbi:MAG TPA: hypothetical protein VEA99_07925, partial [Gemmatimonadaceae bacterium]|nr:hypothetical protein [Gemmatimonadaceae bacterium]